MITKLYANNFRCLVAFTAELDSFGFLCGANGAGKSSVFDAVHLLQFLGSGDGQLGSKGDPEKDEPDLTKLEFTRWLDSRTQEFELAIAAGGYQFEYLIHLEQTAEYEMPRIIRESAKCDGHTLFERELAEVTLSKSDGSTASFPLDWRQAALAAIQPRGSMADKLEVLQDAISSLLILRPSPRHMEIESRGETRQPRLSMTDLISWFRPLYQEQEWADALRDSLQDVWPDFRSFRLVDVGINAKALQLRFESEGYAPVLLDTGQLSDGERALIALYMVRAAVQTGSAHTVLIDEPDNFVGLSELQPWVLAMRELLDDEHQLIMISHHPEILSNSGTENGHYLWRDNHASPTRIGTLKAPDGMAAGEAIARGWVNGK